MSAKYRAPLSIHCKTDRYVDNNQYPLKINGDG